MQNADFFYLKCVFDIILIAHGMHGKTRIFIIPPTDFYRQRLKDRWFTDFIDFFFFLSIRYFLAPLKNMLYG